MWYCNNITSVTKALDKGYQIQKIEVEARAEMVPDAVIDRDISNLKEYFSWRAWKVVEQTREICYR